MHSEAPDVTLWQVVRNDPFGLILGWMLGIGLASAPILWILQTPERSSLLELVATMAVIAAVALAVLHLRRRRIRRLLESGPRVRAKLERSHAIGQIVVLKVRFAIGERRFDQSVSVPYTRASLALRERKDVTLAVDPKDPRSAVVVDLFTAEE